MELPSGINEKYKEYTVIHCFLRALSCGCCGYSHLSLVEWIGDAFDIVVYLDAKLK